MADHRLDDAARRLARRLLVLSEVASSGARTCDRTFFAELQHLLEELAREAGAIGRTPDQAASRRMMA
jgi:hypothetical protein